MSLKIGFSRFLGAVPGRLHFAAHSHHPWPDVSFEAHQRAWLDAAALADQKWGKVFDEVLPRAQAHVARTLGLPDPSTVCFAPSTHELVVRLLSGLDRSPLRVLTTDSEFHSFERQMRRLEEDGLVRAERVPVEPFDDFLERFTARIAAGEYDLLYFSHCFYNSAYRIPDLERIVAAVPDGEIPVVVDGYHAYMAVPVDLSALHGRIFYTAGGYKYAMVGEGACFMHCPAGYVGRPRNTGWYAGFSDLTATRGRAVSYPQTGQRFMGSTYDPTPLYRLNAVMDWLQEQGVGVGAIHQHAAALQARFLEQWAAGEWLPGARLLPPLPLPRGHFLVFDHPEAGNWHARLLRAGVMTDFRDTRLRIGFGIYQDAADVDALGERLQALS